MTTTEQIHTKQLWLAIRFTHFPLESLGINRNAHSSIVSHKSKVCALTDDLLKHNINLGMPTATAQLVCDDSTCGSIYNNQENTFCRVYERQVENENNVLEILSQHLYRYTPHIERYTVTTPTGYDELGLLLELSSCIRLFKGLERLTSNIEHVLKDKKLSYHSSLGHTKHMAWLLSYTSTQIEKSSISATTANDFIKRLAPLNISYLYEYSDIIEKVKKCGFFVFSDLIKHIDHVSLHSFRKRFGQEFTDHIANIFDIEAKFNQPQLFTDVPISYHPEKKFLENIQFDHPISNIEQLTHPLKVLLGCLSDELIGTQSETQSICWCFYDIHHQKKEMVINFDRLHANSEIAMDLTLIQLENQALPFEVDILELRCDKILPVNFENTAIPIDANNRVEKNDALIIATAKINARLGGKGMFTLSSKDSHIPELSFKKNNINNTDTSPITTPNLTTTENQTHADRPSWVFNIPIKAGKQQNSLYWEGKLELLQGPERIEGLWWKKPTGRDYFVAKRSDNTRLWVFHDLYKDEWFVHGVFA